MLDCKGHRLSFKVHSLEPSATLNRRRRYALYECITGLDRRLSVSSADSFLGRFGIKPGDIVGICINDAGELIIDCDTPDFPCPPIRSAYAASSGGSSDLAVEARPGQAQPPGAAARQAARAGAAASEMPSGGPVAASEGHGGP